jgi:hypothetical protein
MCVTKESNAKLTFQEERVAHPPKRVTVILKREPEVKRC